MELMTVLKQDLDSNRGRPHIQAYLALHRVAAAGRNSEHRLSRIACVPVAALARAWGLFGLGIDIPLRTRIGPGLAVHHGVGLVVHADCVIGQRVTLRHSTTLGSRRGGVPRVEDDADVGPGVIVLGPVTVGAASVVGAGSVVLHDVPAGTVVAGNPASETRRSRN